MWELTIHGVDMYHILSWLILYSFLGWVWETSYVSAKQGRYVNRGFISGPLCTIYGFGAISVYLILKDLDGNTLILFAGGVVVATVLEYVTAVLMEWIFHTSWWDYSHCRFNFQGRICLGASLGWGLFTVLLFRVLHPMVSRVVELYPRNVGEIGVLVILVLYAVDFGFSAAAAFHLRERIPEWEEALEQRQAELLLKVRQNMEELERNHGFSVDDFRNNVKDRLENTRLIRELEERRAGMMNNVSIELRNHKEKLAKKSGLIIRRYVKAYPNLNRTYKRHHSGNEKKKDETK